MTPLIGAGVALWMLVAAPAGGGQDRLPPAERTYVLGCEDEISVRVVDVEEFRDEPVRIDSAGFVNLPLVGRHRAAGLTIEAFEKALAAALAPYVRSASVIVSVRTFRSQPVSVMGAVNKPGTYQLQGRKTLIEVLSLAEGLRPDAGNTIRINRRSGAVPSGSPGVLQVPIKELLDGLAPESDIPVIPGDVISIARAEMVYVMGCVRRSGGFILGERSEISVLQALALAEGLDVGAAPQRGRIIRTSAGVRSELAIDIRRILEGKSEDLRLRPNDLLFVPASSAKKATLRGLEAAVQIGTGIAIWGRR